MAKVKSKPSKKPFSLSQIIKSKKFAAVAGITLSALVIIGGVAFVTGGIATSCHSYWARADNRISSDFYAADKVYVPYNSGCSSIKIDLSTIQRISSAVPCARFRVHFYQLQNGKVVKEFYGNTYTECARDPGTLTLATDVLNGTLYRVEASNSLRFVVKD